MRLTWRVLIDADPAPVFAEENAPALQAVEGAFDGVVAAAEEPGDFAAGEAVGVAAQNAGQGALATANMAQNDVLILGPFGSDRVLQDDGSISVTFTPASGTKKRSAKRCGASTANIRRARDSRAASGVPCSRSPT